jgi:hypothetical protein
MAVFTRQGEAVMALSSSHVDALIDILENKLSDMLVWDGEDRKEVVTLKGCLDELHTMKLDTVDVIAFKGAKKRWRPASAA